MVSGFSWFLFPGYYPLLIPWVIYRVQSAKKPFCVCMLFTVRFHWTSPNPQYPARTAAWSVKGVEVKATTSGTWTPLPSFSEANTLTLEPRSPQLQQTPYLDYWARSFLFQSTSIASPAYSTRQVPPKSISEMKTFKKKYRVASRLFPGINAEKIKTRVLFLALHTAMFYFCRFPRKTWI